MEDVTGKVNEKVGKNLKIAWDGSWFAVPDLALNLITSRLSFIETRVLLILIKNASDHRRGYADLDAQTIAGLLGLHIRRAYQGLGGLKRHGAIVPDPNFRNRWILKSDGIQQTAAGVCDGFRHKTVTESVTDFDGIRHKTEGDSICISSESSSEFISEQHQHQKPDGVGVGEKNLEACGKEKDTRRDLAKAMENFGVWPGKIASCLAAAPSFSIEALECFKNAIAKSKSNPPGLLATALLRQGDAYVASILKTTILKTTGALTREQRLRAKMEANEDAPKSAAERTRERLRDRYATELAAELAAERLEGLQSSIPKGDKPDFPVENPIAAQNCAA